MTEDQKLHLLMVKNQFLQEVDTKYKKGQEEHGGDLWKKPGMLKMLGEETVDFYVYKFALKQQIEKARDLLVAGKVKEALQVLEDILGDPID